MTITKMLKELDPSVYPQQAINALNEWDKKLFASLSREAGISPLKIAGYQVLQLAIREFENTKRNGTPFAKIGVSGLWTHFPDGENWLNIEFKYGTPVHCVLYRSQYNILSPKKGYRLIGKGMMLNINPKSSKKHSDAEHFAHVLYKAIIKLYK